MTLANQFLLDKKVTFLNHGSFGACPIKIFNEYQSWQEKLENQPVKFLDQYRDFGPNMTNVRKILSKKINHQSFSMKLLILMIHIHKKFMMLK